ncbi:MAG: RagB/SusD family nutrient uptake outer membrane protein [Mangrovibacterium sp.]
MAVALLHVQKGYFIKGLTDCRQGMIRFGKFLNPIPGWKTSSVSIYLLFPIPQTVLDENPGLRQNPGY